MDTKTALLDSAEKVIRSQGFDGFSYADLSAEVGIRKASIHYHFPTKADLGHCVLDRYSGLVFDHLEGLATPDRTGGQRLTGYIDLYREALNEGRMVCLCVALTISRDSLPSNIVDGLSRFHAKNVDWLTHQFGLAAQDGSIDHVGVPLEEAHQCLALVEGAQLLAHATQDLERFDAATKLLGQRLR